jgi:hypothetical protein
MLPTIQYCCTPARRRLYSSCSYVAPNSKRFGSWQVRLGFFLMLLQLLLLSALVHSCYALQIKPLNQPLHRRALFDISATCITTCVAVAQCAPAVAQEAFSEGVSVEGIAKVRLCSLTLLYIKQISANSCFLLHLCNLGCSEHTRLWSARLLLSTILLRHMGGDSAST